MDLFERIKDTAGLMTTPLEIQTPATETKPPKEDKIVQDSRSVVDTIRKKYQGGQEPDTAPATESNVSDYSEKAQDIASAGPKSIDPGKGEKSPPAGIPEPVPENSTPAQPIEASFASQDPAIKANVKVAKEYTIPDNVTFKPKVEQWRDTAAPIAAKYGVPLNLVMGVIQQESGGNPTVASPVGAGGLMQLMPATAKSLGVQDRNDPAQNIEGGVKYLAQQLETFDGDVSKALAAYNAGPGNVRKYGGVPPFKETQGYVKSITASLGIDGTATVEGIKGPEGFTEPTSQPKEVKITANTKKELDTMKTGDVVFEAIKEIQQTNPELLWGSVKDYQKTGDQLSLEKPLNYFMSLHPTSVEDMKDFLPNREDAKAIGRGFVKSLEPFAHVFDSAGNKLKGMDNNLVSNAVDFITSGDALTMGVGSLIVSQLSKMTGIDKPKSFTEQFETSTSPFMSAINDGKAEFGQDPEAYKDLMSKVRNQIYEFVGSLPVAAIGIGSIQKGLQVGAPIAMGVYNTSTELMMGGKVEDALLHGVTTAALFGTAGMLAKTGGAMFKLGELGERTLGASFVGGMMGATGSTVDDAVFNSLLGFTFGFNDQGRPGGTKHAEQFKIDLSKQGPTPPGVEAPSGLKAPKNLEPLPKAVAKPNEVPKALADAYKNESSSGPSQSKSSPGEFRKSLKSGIEFKEEKGKVTEMVTPTDKFNKIYKATAEKAATSNRTLSDLSELASGTEGKVKLLQGENNPYKEVLSFTKSLETEIVGREYLTRIAGEKSKILPPKLETVLENPELLQRVLGESREGMNAEGKKISPKDKFYTKGEFKKDINTAQKNIAIVTRKVGQEAVQSVGLDANYLIDKVPLSSAINPIEYQSMIQKKTGVPSGTTTVDLVSGSVEKHGVVNDLVTQSNMPAFVKNYKKAQKTLGIKDEDFVQWMHYARTQKNGVVKWDESALRSGTKVDIPEYPNSVPRPTQEQMKLVFDARKTLDLLQSKGLADYRQGYVPHRKIINPREVDSLFESVNTKGDRSFESIEHPTYAQARKSGKWDPTFISNPVELMQRYVNEVASNKVFGPLVPKVAEVVSKFEFIGRGDLAQKFMDYAGDVMGLPNNKMGRNVVFSEMANRNPKILGDIISAVTDKNMPLSQDLYHAAMKSMYKTFVSGNLRQQILQAIQPEMMGASEIGAKHMLAGRIAYHKAFATKNETWQLLQRPEIKNRLIKETDYMQLADFKSDISRRWVDVSEKVLSAPMTPLAKAYNKMEAINRPVSFLGGYNEFKSGNQMDIIAKSPMTSGERQKVLDIQRTGNTEAAAIEYGIIKANRINFIYDWANKPDAFRNGLFKNVPFTTWGLNNWMRFFLSDTAGEGRVAGIPIGTGKPLSVAQFGARAAGPFLLMNMLSMATNTDFTRGAPVANLAGTLDVGLSPMYENLLSAWRENKGLKILSDPESALKFGAKSLGFISWVDLAGRVDKASKQDSAMGKLKALGKMKDYTGPDFIGTKVDKNKEPRVKSLRGRR